MIPDRRAKGVVDTVGDMDGSPSIQPAGPDPALTSCPVCGNAVSRQAPTCPHCGHPINPHKTGATMVLVFGIVAVFLPVLGIVFGGLAWGLGNREVREIDAGLRLPSGRTKARVGQILGVIGIIIWVVATGLGGGDVGP